MDRPINILILEDNPADAELIKRQLRKADFDFITEWAKDKESFIQSLDKFIPDIILADYSLPGFDGLAALVLARERIAEIPVVIVSGAVGEETVIEVMKAGATDYVLKDRLSRLEPVVKRALGEAEQVTEKKCVQDLLLESESRLKRAQEIAHLGSWELDLVKNILTWSDEVYRIFGLQPHEFSATYEAFLEAVHPDDRAAVDTAYSESLAEGKDSYEIDHRIVRKTTGEIRFVHEKCEHIRDKQGRITRSLGMVHDITERRRDEEELKRSNENLEQFAYVASHDLQEPLRIIASYTQLLEKRYKNKLDSEADEFIGYIVDSAVRMQRLINDLLIYSRIGNKYSSISDVDCNDVLRRVIDNLSIIIKSSSAKISFDKLPVVKADETGIMQLFQNLLHNALKFCGSSPLIIRVGVKREKVDWRFFVQDNGIGIEPQYHKRIFLIFQRLHPRDKYPGTGIGLSICKKIVENYGGKIWVESEPENGSTFYFSIPIERK